MTVRKADKQVSATKAHSGPPIGKPPSWAKSIRRHLSPVAGIDAVYTWVDLRNVVHVISVVKDHDSELYDALIPKEERVEKENTGVSFDFHVRARQSRTVERTVPAGCLLVFKK